MLKIYKYEYNFFECQAELSIDTRILSEKDCEALLAFFTWDFDPSANCYDELGRLYCCAAMRFATINNHNLAGVINDFKTEEGFLEVNGKFGVTLMRAEGIDFFEIEMNVCI